MNPNIMGPIEKAIKNVLKNVSKYEFDSDLLFEEEKQSRETEDTKGISLRGLIWRELGEEAFNEWYKFYKHTANTVNQLYLAIALFGKLLKHGYRYVQEVESRYEKNHPRSVARKNRPVIHLSDEKKPEGANENTGIKLRLRDKKSAIRKKLHVFDSGGIEDVRELLRVREGREVDRVRELQQRGALGVCRPSSSLGVTCRRCPRTTGSAKSASSNSSKPARPFPSREPSRNLKSSPHTIAK